MSGGGPEPGLLVTERVRLVRELARGGMGSVWVANHLTLGVDVAVKFLVVDDPGRRERLAREARLGARVDHPHAVRILDHGTTAGGLPFLVMELVHGPTLAQHLDLHGPLPLADVRRLVAQVGGALATAHRAGVLHRDVKPSNVILLDAPAGLHAKLIDFGIARTVDGGDGTLTATGQVVGTTFYLAPEQLLDGVPADPRADLWGLSTVAYEALTCRRPYAGGTAAAIGAAMVLRRRDPVTATDAALPAALDAWFDRALHLDPAERHPSALELVASFEEAATSSVGGPTRRATPVFRVSRRLRGRENELGGLLEAWAEVAAGAGSRVVWIGGWSGVGKTALVEELRARLRDASVAFGAGKFDPFGRGTPYQGLSPALREVLRRSVADPATGFRDRVLQRVGDLARALCDVVEDAAALFGDPTTDDAIGGAERRNQVHEAIARLIGALATPDRPLVLFLDDLQWADPASLDLLAALASAPDGPPVLWIGAYRDNEVGPGDALSALIERLGRTGRTRALVLGPLTEEAVVEIVSETFPDSPGRLRLASLLYARTHGNVFFLRRLLESLVEQRTIAFDHATRLWSWDPAAVEATGLAPDVLAFVAAELGRMPVATRDAVAVAAAVGDPFDLDLLARALSCDRSVALERLSPAMATELVAAVARSAPSDSPDELRFRFVHDRVRQAARGLLAADEARTVHRRVAEALLERQGAERDRRLFELAEHLNLGSPAVVPEVDRQRLVATNLAAARKALRSAAFAAAHAWFGQAVARVTDADWAGDRLRTAALHVEAARAAWLAQDPPRTEALLAAALGHAVDAVDRTAAHEVHLQSLLSAQRFREGLALAIHVLADLGAPVPAEAGPADAQAAVADTLGRLGCFGEAELQDLPTTSDPVVQARQRIRIGAMSTAYMAAPSLLPVLACDIVRSTLSDGVTRESPYGFAALGLVLNAAGQLEAAHANGRIAAEMLDRVGDRAMRPRVRHLLGAHVLLFVDPLRDCIEIERQVARAGLEAGDLEYAAWGQHVEVCNGLYAGLELGGLRRTCERHLASLRHHGQLAALGCTVQYERAIARLTGAPDPADADEDRWLAEGRAANFRGAVFVTATVGTFLRYVSGDAAGAAAFADAHAEYADGAAATYHQVWWHQWRALAHLGARGADAVPHVQGDLGRLRAWQRVGPHNHDHRVHLVEGEIARVSGRGERALAHFDEAVASALANGFLAEEAVAHERAAEVDPALRGERLRRARAAWRRWGAAARVAALDAELGEG